MEVFHPFFSNPVLYQVLWRRAVKLRFNIAVVSLLYCRHFKQFCICIVM